MIFKKQRDAKKKKQKTKNLKADVTAGEATVLTL